MSQHTAPGPRPQLVAFALITALLAGFLASLPAAPAAAATCPCSIFTSSQAPTTPSDPDSSAVELGVKFRSDSNGYITGIRFYKGSGNTGTHTGSLWNTAGNQLATVTFTGETSSGWQQAMFASPVAITANTTYIASYYAPNGHYAADAGYFASAGVVNSPLTALQDGTDGGNGVYRYGTGGGFPTSNYQSTNYWVDPIFDTSGTDTTPPTVTDQSPATGATGVATSSAVTASFSEAVDPSTVVMTLAAGGNAVDSSTTYTSGTRTETLTPTAALAASTTYTVSLSGAQDLAGNQMAPVSWTFTTAANASTCPCSIWSASTTPQTSSTADSSAVELGVKFTSSQDGFITGIRFYKGSGNTGTHVGTLWSSTGTSLASATFTGETASGWQSVTLPAPVQVNANTTYVASYFAPAGHYANNSNYFGSAGTTNGPLTAVSNGAGGGNGVYRYGASGFPSSSYNATNYWVDVVFSTTADDTIPPALTDQVPADGMTGVAANSTVSATFSEPVQSGTINMVLKDASNTVVSTTFSYANRVATLTPSSPLAYSSAYTVSVSGAKDPSGNTMSAVSWTFTTGAKPSPPPDQGPGGPIAVITSSSNPYSKYLAEILRTEGLNEFATVDVSDLSASTLSAYRVVVVGDVGISDSQAATLTTWVNGGGNLIAMHPAAALSSLLGITPATGSVSDGYLKVDTATAPGAGIVSDTIQFHGNADRYTLSGAQSIATLYTDASTATSNPAVTLNSVGSSGGEAAAFTYDLPRSIVAMRQGNQAWAGQERDGLSPIRSDDMFFAGGSVDWVDLNKVAIPQADEQQRLLANLIQVMNRNTMPLPRFWYFPRSLKAVLVGTGDDHGNAGTPGRFDQMLANSPSGCSVSNWTCYRYSSYVYPDTPGLTDSAAASYTNQGFEVGVHETTNCQNFTPSSLAADYSNDLSVWKANYPSLRNTPPVSNRTHCIAFSDWSSQPKTELANGMRLDTNYYYYPGSWVQDRPGFMTGSGMPMRFADIDGTMIDVYQAASQMTDESAQTYPATIDSLLDNSTCPAAQQPGCQSGSLGFYGAFTANFHTDQSTEPESDALISSAQAHNVPIVSGKQMLTWLDGRNASSYSNLSWSNNTLSFTVNPGTGADGLTGMLPTAGPNGTLLTGITKGASPVSYTTSTIKGIEYASFDAAAGSYSATYAAPPATMAVTAMSVNTGAATASPMATASWTTNAVSTSQVAVGTSPTALTTKVTVGEATRKHAVTARALKAGTTYYYRVTSTDLKGRTVTSPSTGQAPASFTTPAADTTPPKVTAARVTPIPGGIATVRWTTNEPSTGVVQLGLSTTAMHPAAAATDLSTDHALVLRGLDPSKTYYVNGISTDAAGNTGTSGTKQFITPAWGVSEQSAPAFRRGTATGNAAVGADSLGSVTLSGATSQARSGTFVSGLMDAQRMVDWDRAYWDATKPSGVTATLAVRFGSTAAPDSTWSGWQSVPADGRVVGSSRYIQYRVQMSAPAGVAAPSLWAIGFSNNGGRIVPPTETGG
ncbi:MAG TPA: DUF4082 domain-containing protein [Microlunatus sp.]|nr:DUF4082 domain-containing protein [Microlunatus sp.]